MSDDTFTKSDGTEVTPEMQRNAARKIGGLIRMSQDETLTPEARASYAEKAEELMREYRTAEEKVISSGFSSSLPVRYDIILLEGFGTYVNDFQMNYIRIWGEIRKHAGLVGHVEYVYDERDGRKIVAVGYGYEIDIRLAEFLWTSAHLVFATRIDPKVDPKLSDQLNCYYLRGSGLPRVDIATALWGSGPKDGAAHGKVQRLYLAECEARDEKPLVMGRGIQVSKYREAYAEAFVNQFGWRLRVARDAADAKSGLPVLHGRTERIAEPYYVEFPDKRPASEEERARRAAKAAEYLAQEAAEEANCVACAKTTSQTGKCKRHRPRYATEADYRRWNREANSPEKAAGERAGAAAASSVDFRRTATDRAQSAGAAAERRAIG